MILDVTQFLDDPCVKLTVMSCHITAFPQRSDVDTCHYQSTSSSCFLSKPPYYLHLIHSLLRIFQDPNDDDLDDDTDTMLPPGEVRTGADVEAGEEARAEGLKPADIDAYWLQRNVNKAYNNTLDENEAVKKAEEVFNALQVSGVSSCTGVCCYSFALGAQ